MTATATCPNGHLYTAETTTHVASHGRRHRRCRLCHRAADRAWRVRRADAGALARAYRAGWAAARGVGGRADYRRGWEDRRLGRGYHPPEASPPRPFVQDS